MDNKPRLFTKLTIVIFSTLGTTFFGAVLYSTNLRETNKSKFIAPAIIFSIIFTYANNKLAQILQIPTAYLFLPIHLIGGLILAGPFWKYQIGDVNNFPKRKIWGPTIVLLVPIALYFVFFFYNKSQQGMSVSEFTETTKFEYNKALDNAKFVTQDSLVTFFDLNLPVIASSYYFTTKVEDANTLYNQIDYDEGRFTAMCTRMPLSTKDVFDLSMFKGYTLTPVDSVNSEFKSLVCANYIRNVGDTLSVKGTIALIKIGNIGYHYVTQYTDLNKKDADNLSLYLINNIYQDSTAKAIRELGLH